jgi:hypothetical protein
VSGVNRVHSCESVNASKQVKTHARCVVAEHGARWARCGRDCTPQALQVAPATQVIYPCLGESVSKGVNRGFRGKAGMGKKCCVQVADVHVGAKETKAITDALVSTGTCVGGVTHLASLICISRRLRTVS